MAAWFWRPRLSLRTIFDATLTGAPAGRAASCRRGPARVRRHQDELFTFLNRPEADLNDNFADRQARPAVILPVKRQSIRSSRGADTQATLMSFHRTLKFRGLDPRSVIECALRTYAVTATLPPLPTAVAVSCIVAASAPTSVSLLFRCRAA